MNARYAVQMQRVLSSVAGRSTVHPLLGGATGAGQPYSSS
jgi:hypothetical protein